MATRSCVQSGLAENGIPFAAAASTATNFAAADVLNIGTFSLILNSAITQATVTLAAGGTLYLAPGGSLSVTTLGSFVGNIVHTTGYIPSTATGSPITGALSGGSVPGVFVQLGN